MTQSALSLPLAGRRQRSLAWLQIALMIYLLLLAVALIGSGFKTASREEAQTLFAFATNPFAGLLTGILATALLQSSSTVTAIVVGLVAGGMPVSLAVPMVMGANVGTTITNTLVSLAHWHDGAQFRRAFAAATVHDLFNLLGVLVFLPLELLTGLLRHSAAALVEVFSSSANWSLTGLSPVKALTQPVVQGLAGQFAALGEGPLAGGDRLAGVALLLLGVGLLLLAILRLGTLLRSVLVGRARLRLHAALGGGALRGIGTGTLVTTVVQSSSTTTSLLVPLAGAGVFSTRDIYPFTLGANIGTTVTALLAATAASGALAGAALQIALVHLLFNVGAVALLFLLPLALRQPGLAHLPVRGAEALADLATRRKALALVYVLGLYFALPAALVFSVGSR